MSIQKTDSIFFRIENTWYWVKSSLQMSHRSANRKWDLKNRKFKNIASSPENNLTGLILNLQLKLGR